MTATRPPSHKTSQPSSPSGRTSSPVIDRGALAGCMISGIAGLGWAQWGASGLSGGTSVAIRIFAAAVGVMIIARSARLRRSARAGSGSMFGSRAYLLVVVLEVVGLVAGAEILGALGDGGYAPAWYATVVGIHFLAFGRLFHASFYWLGAALLVGGVAGALVGLSSGGRAGIEATSGLIAAASLLAAGGWRVLGPSLGPAA